MKKIFILSAMLLAGFISQGQVNGRAIGLRLGTGNVNSGEISYQHGMGEANRLELDLGFGGNSNHSRMNVTGIYHWDWNLTKALNWYIGPGASVGFYSYDNAEDYINIAIGGQVGIEYDFNREAAVPILLSLDARPMWNTVGNNNGLGWGAALGIRYIWGSSPGSDNDKK